MDKVSIINTANNNLYIFNVAVLLSVIGTLLFLMINSIKNNIAKLFDKFETVNEISVKNSVEIENMKENCERHKK